MPGYNSVLDFTVFFRACDCLDVAQIACIQGNASTEGEAGASEAPRIAAADALKAALAKGGSQTTRTQAKGISLPGPVAEFNVDDFPSSSVQQLQVS